MIKNVLFDLDGTLLPMDMDEFTNGYFAFLVKKAMGHSDKYTKDEYFTSVYGEESLEDKAIFDDFYANAFEQAKQFCGKNEDARKVVDSIKEAGFRVVLATNPVFPEVATRKRAIWAGFNVDEFEAFTTYENSHFCKPNPEYYKELLTKLDMKASECLMVGNDVDEDMEAGIKAGMQTFLITDCLINKRQVDINKYPHGSFNDLWNYITTILK